MNRYLSSRDGIMITYTRRGSGPPLILIGGGLDDGSENEPLAIELASEFTTYNFARRGRGESGDAAPYEVARELEDIAALIAVAGGEAHLLGISSGGMYALEAAAAGLPVLRVAVYELRTTPIRTQATAMTGTGVISTSRCPPVAAATP